jgi:hypothetical protein
MEFICTRCNHIAKQKLYRVTAEEGGAVLLDLLVCASCARLARRLGIRTAKMESAERAAVMKRHKMTTSRKQKTVQPRTSFL